jgi:hypothetical protein
MVYVEQKEVPILTMKHMTEPERVAFLEEVKKEMAAKIAESLVKDGILNIFVEDPRQPVVIDPNEEITDEIIVRNRLRTSLLERQMIQITMTLGI